MVLGFWLVLLVVVGGFIGYAAYADAKARKRGMILIPVRQNRFGRTTFEAVPREEVRQRKLEAELDRREREKQERAGEDGMLTMRRYLRSGRR